MDKLVRDLIPEIILKNENRKAKTHIANNLEYRSKLYEKLIEEAREFVKDENPEELADLLEVVRTIVKLNHWKYKDIETKRINKSKQRGKFNKRIILEI